MARPRRAHLSQTPTQTSCWRSEWGGKAGCSTQAPQSPAQPARRNVLLFRDRTLRPDLPRPAPAPHCPPSPPTHPKAGRWPQGEEPVQASSQSGNERCPLPARSVSGWARLRGQEAYSLAEQFLLYMERTYAFPAGRRELWVDLPRRRGKGQHWPGPSTLIPSEVLWARGRDAGLCSQVRGEPRRRCSGH